MNLPKRITPCPIIDTSIDVRFESDSPSVVILGKIINDVIGNYPTLEELPILQFPEELRKNDPDLKYKPTHKISNHNFILQVGPNVFCFGSGENYQGWDNYSREFNRLLSKIIELPMILKFSRIGLRYINFFSEDIYANISLQVLHNNSDLQSFNKLVKFELRKDSFNQSVTIANNTSLVSNNKPLFGSVIDIDTYTSSQNDLVKTEIINSFEKAHNTEKELFFNLLNTSFIEKLNPEF